MGKDQSKDDEATREIKAEVEVLKKGEVARVEVAGGLPTFTRPQDVLFPSLAKNRAAKETALLDEQRRQVQAHTELGKAVAEHFHVGRTIGKSNQVREEHLNLELDQARRQVTYGKHEEDLKLSEYEKAKLKSQLEREELEAQLEERRRARAAREQHAKSRTEAPAPRPSADKLAEFTQLAEESFARIKEIDKKRNLTPEAKETMRQAVNDELARHKKRIFGE